MTTDPVRIPGVVVDEIPHAVPAAAPVQPEPEPGAPVDATVPASAPVEAAAPVAPTADAAEPVEKKKATSRAAGMASGGAPVESPGAPPPTPTWPAPRNPDEAYVPEEFDFSDLMDVNRELNRARARLFRVSQQLKVAQRTLAEAQSDYDRAMRREMVSISGGTAESRKAMAEIRCEQFENRIIIGKQIVEEWRKRSMDVRDDLKAVENIAHNVRAQMDIR